MPRYLLFSSTYTCNSITNLACAGILDRCGAAAMSVSYAILVVVVFAMGLVGVQRYQTVDALPTAPEYKLNLDLPPEERWAEIAKAHSGKLSRFFRDAMVPKLSALGLEMLSIIGAALLKDMPQPYRDEMVGFAKYSNISIGTIVFWNIVTELGSFSVNQTKHFNPEKIGCTSIVAEDSKGVIIHGRNMDLEWGTDILRNITLHIHFQSKNKTVYSGTAFAGLVGLWTGQKPHQFTVTMNERDKDGWQKNAQEATKPGRKVIPFLIRDLLADEKSTFASAVETFSTTPLIAPCYLIVGGAHPGEGAVITRNRTKAIDVVKLNTTQGRWNVLETNYDHWDAPPSTDDRRNPAIKAMNETGKDKISLDSILKVLSTPPVLANDTIYTVLMSASQPDLYKTLIRGSK